jgi:hypothetical protein
MPIRRRLPTLRLDALDELINARKSQHGGRRGAPPIVRGERVGAAINKSCILMLSALLQGFVENVFVEASRRTFKSLRTAETVEWPAPGFEDTEFGVLMEPEVRHGEAEVYTRVQA